MSRSSLVAAEVNRRAALAVTANGATTNIGRLVLRGRVHLNHDEDIPCTVMIEGDETVENKLGEALITQDYVLEGHAECVNVDYPNDTCHAIVEELKRAIWSTDWRTFDDLIKQNSLTYKGRAFGDRVAGSNLCSAAVSFSVQFVEQLSNP